MPYAMERLLRSPVTRIFLPERKPIVPIILSAVPIRLKLQRFVFSGLLLFAITASQAADPGKVLRVTFQAAETGFDPVKVADAYSGSVIEAIFDPLLTYDYLPRPAMLVANAAAAMPVVSVGGKTDTCTIRHGL